MNNELETLKRVLKQFMIEAALMESGETCNITPETWENAEHLVNDEKCDCSSSNKGVSHVRASVK